MHRIFLFLALLLTGLFAGPARAQSEVPAELLDRPPVAAPTDRIEVAPIQVVRSASEQIDDFAAGLIQGAATLAHVPGVALVVVRDDHIVVQRNFGSLTPDTAFDAGTLSDVFLAVAAMREIEQGKLAPDDDVSKAFGEVAPRGITVGQLLTHRAGDARLLAQLVEKVSGMPLANGMTSNVFQPLVMGASTAEAAGFRTSAADVAHLMIALLNGGRYETSTPLQPATVETMERTQFAAHPALSGMTYGFAEMRRNGWRALVHDGQSPRFQIRIVIVPEARLGYVLAVQGEAGEEFWNIVDNALFDRSLALRSGSEINASNMPPPTLADARGAAGIYTIADDYAASLTALKRGARRIRVRARDDGALLLSGTGSGALLPRAGGYWSSEDGNTQAAVSASGIAIGAESFVSLPLWQRPLLYTLLALLVAVLGAVGLFYEMRRDKRSWRNPSDLVLASASASVALLLLSAFVWLLSPAA